MSWRFIICTALFVTCLLTANTIAAKLVVVGGLTLTAGIVIFPISYVLGDVLTEVWGYAATRRVIWLGFACNALMVLAIWLGGELPAAPFWRGQAAYQEILGHTPRILVRLVRGLPGRRVRQRLRAGQAQDRHPGPLALDAHDRLDRGGAGARQRRLRHAGLRRDRSRRRAGRDRGRRSGSSRSPTRRSPPRSPTRRWRG